MTGEGGPESTREHLATVARGGAVGLVGAVAAGVAGFVLVVVVTRSMDAADAGVFFAVTSLFGLLMALAQLGTDTGLGRFVLRNQARGPQDVRATVRAALLPSLGLSVLLALLMGLAGGQLARAAGLGAEAVVLVRLLSVMLPAAVLAEVCLSAARAHGLMGSTVLVDRFLRAWFQPAAVIVLLLLGASLVPVSLGWASAYLFSAVLAVLSLRALLLRRGALDSRPAPGRAREVFREFWSFTWLRSVARVAQVGIQKVDIVLVAALLSPAAAAAYTVATRFVPFGQFGTQAIQMALQPRFTAILLEGDRRALAEVYRTATAWGIVLAWPVYLGVAALAGTYLALFGHGFDSDGARTVVWVMSGAMLLAAASGPVDTLLLMAGRSGASALNAGLALAVDVVGCLVLLPLMGIGGAAWAWAAAVLTRVGLAVVQVHRATGVHAFGGSVLLAAVLPVLSVFLPLFLLSRLTDQHLVLLAAAALCCLAHLAVLWMFRAPLGLDHFAAAVRRSRTTDPTPTPGHPTPVVRQRAYDLHGRGGRG